MFLRTGWSFPEVVNKKLAWSTVPEQVLLCLRRICIEFHNDRIEVLNTWQIRYIRGNMAIGSRAV